MRSMLNFIQGIKLQNKTNITIDDIKKSSSVYKDIFDLIFKETDPVKNYEYLVSNYSNRVDDVLVSLGNEFVEYVKIEQPDFIKCIPQITICVCKYQVYKNTSIDAVIPMVACIYELQNIIKISNNIS